MTTAPSRSPAARQDSQSVEQLDEADRDVADMREIAQGNQRAFSQFMTRHLDRVYALALRYTANPADAEDIAQGTFDRVWRKADSYRSDTGKVTTWLSTIAINLCRDHSRRAKLRRWLPFENTEPLAEPGPGPDTIAADRAQLAAVRDAITKLPERQRAAILLVGIGGHSNAETAEILGVSKGAIEQALFRGRQTLKRLVYDE